MENSAATVDMISNLPDELLCHILSFLPTKLAFTTTLLSKRWAPLCYSLTALCFDDDTVKDAEGFNRFCGFVDKLMLFPSAANQPIKTFHLKLSQFYKVDHQSFHAWVEAIKQRRVEELHLLLDNVTLKNLTIFTSRTLVVVKLERLKVEGENLCVDLPNLKTLHLRYVCFETRNNFMKLLKACPILQNLHASFLIYRRHDENNKVEEFKPLFLSKLVRARFFSTDIPFNLISNVEFLHIVNVGEALKGIRFKSIPVFQNLISIQLWFFGLSYGWNGVVDMLQNCPKLQILFIREWCSCLSNKWKCPIPVIECVSSCLRSCTILNSYSSANDLAFATYILQNARRLQVMTIKGTAQSSNGLQKRQIIQELSSCPRISPECKLSFAFK